MSLWAKKSRIAITCAKGISSYLEKEVRSLGFPVLSEGMAEVGTEGTLEDTMRLNLLIRTGHRVLFLIDSLSAKNPDELYKRVARINWEDYISAESYFCVTSSVNNPTIKDSRFANLKCKDAIVDRMNEKLGRRPDSGPDRDRVVVHLYWRGEKADIFFDTSGEPLSRRGYKRIPLKAPMQETLAAAVIMATGWQGNGNFINPMSGGGTLAIEAAMIALNRAPGLLRNNFGFMHLKGFSESSWRITKNKVKMAEKDRFPGRIVATDISQQAVDASKKNAMTAGIERFVEFGICDFSETPIPNGGGVIIFNPEYGERLGEAEELKKVYKGIGDFLKMKCQGYTGYIFTGNPDLAKRVGLRTKRRLSFLNGPIECRLLEYDLYEGSRRGKTPNEIVDGRSQIVPACQQSGIEKSKI
jgi:23S rRNA G2445 N2-methylase RlmL